MKAKLGNIIVDVWAINKEESPENYPAWLKTAQAKKLVRWRHEKGANGNVSGVLFDNFMKGKEFAKPDVVEEIPDALVVTSYGPFPSVGYPGDYLVYSEAFTEKYRIISEHRFAKEYEVLDEGQ